MIAALYFPSGMIAQLTKIVKEQQIQTVAAPNRTPGIQMSVLYYLWQDRSSQSLHELFSLKVFIEY